MHHRWHNVHREFRVLGFVLWRWKRVEHRYCEQPEAIGRHVVQLQDVSAVDQRTLEPLFANRNLRITEVEPR